MTDESLKRRRKRRSRSSAWLCQLLVLVAVNHASRCRGAFIAPLHQSSLLRQGTRYNHVYRQRRQSTATETEQDLRENVELVAVHPEQKLELASDVINCSINVTKVDFSPSSLKQHSLHQNNQNDPTNAIPKHASQEPVTQNAPTTLRSMWRRRHARTALEGIRREKTNQLSNLLAKTNYAKGRRYGARTIMGLIHALAEEVVDLDVQVDARPHTPLWDKRVDAIRIQFSRLGFKPLRMGGLDQAFHEYKMQFPDTQQGAFYMDRQLYDVSCADEAFERIDVDNSGALDSDEIAEALVVAARSSDETEHRKLKTVMKGVANELVALYDFNGDGVVDRSEYQSMVEDMAALREAQEMEQQTTEDSIKTESTEGNTGGWFVHIKNFVQSFFPGDAAREEDKFSTVFAANNDISNSVADESLATMHPDALPSELVHVNGDSTTVANGDIVDKPSRTVVPESFDWANGYSAKSNRISEVTDEQLASLVSTGKDLGSITISDLKMDLRRLLFGAIPLIKHITPGGPLILEPFTTTITASFNSHDIKNSFLLDAGLRRLVAQAIRRRVRSLRDTIDGAVFYGRTWKMSSTTAPVVDVIAIEDVEFDTSNRLILTGRVRVQTAPEQPIVENAFKLRAKLGTNAAGRRIRLMEPELALVLECPKAWERVVNQCCEFFSISERQKPKPLYFFFPIYSPFKMEDPENDGFDLGEDNKVKSIYIKDNALRFELSAVLRPGRFLGNHYLAFTIPNRTFIITLDRVKEGIRSARMMKQAAKAVEEATAKSRRKLPAELRRLQERKQAQLKRVQPKSFFSRFVDGYVQAERDDANSARVTRAIRDFFSRQSARRLGSRGMSSFTDVAASAERLVDERMENVRVNGDE
ncbi:hypothetical protein MPSEU_000357700 [Mayamaea pseudoterrestris]|nr:hypothetical protein MPSEU_000357700 [Mayamaea pseudoterrestris]